MEHEKLYYGTAYRELPLAIDRLDLDLDQMCAAGMNTIRFGACAWKDWEPEEGKCDFTGLHRVLTAAQKRALQVILVVPTDAVPEWLLEKYLTGNQPDVRSCARRFLCRMLEQCRQYPCIVGYQIADGALDEEEIIIQHELLKEYVQPGQFITCSHHFDTGDSTQADPYRAAEQMDTAGCMVYHKAGCANTGAEISFSSDLARGLKKDNYLVLQTQSQGTVGQLPYPGQLRLAAYHQLAGCADGVIYDGWHSDYSGAAQKGILSHDLSAGRIYRECAALGEEWNRLSDKLVGLRKENRVAILLSKRSSEMANWPGDRSYDDYLKWVYDSFYRLNIEVDILPDTQRDFTGYELLVAPCLYCAEENLIWAIRNFVADGGYLISTFRSFFADENGLVRADAQPYGMTDLFGMSYEEYTVPDQICLPEYEAEVTDWMELLRPNGAQTIGTYGGTGWQDVPAVTVSRFGRGSAAYIGCYTQEGLEPILLRLFSMWHIPVPEISWPVVVKRGVDRQGAPMVYLLHYSDSARVIPSPAVGRELISGVTLEEGAPLELKPWDVKILEGIR